MSKRPAGLDVKEHRRQVRAYRLQYKRYEVYAELLHEFLAQACEERGVEAIVQARPKSVPSFGEKVVRKYDEYPDAVHQLTDLCGARIITLTQSAADRMCAFVRRNFQIDEANSEDTRQRLQPDQFGYASIHYIVQMPWMMLLGLPDFKRALKNLPADKLVGAIASAGADRGLARCCARVGAKRLLQQLTKVMDKDAARGLAMAMDKVLQRRSNRSLSSLVCAIGNRKAEIQVKTVLQHVWAAIGHDRLYKTDYKPPHRLKRRLHRIAAVLEEADDEFASGVAELDALRLDYGSFMTFGQRRAALQKWQVAFAASPGIELALKVARLAESIEEWEAVEAALGPFRNSGNSDVLRLLGAARLAAHGTGRAELAEAVRMNPKDAVAWCYLGDSYCPRSPARGFGLKLRGKLSCDEAVKCYAKAFESAPADPRAVTSYAACRFCYDRCSASLQLLRPPLESVYQVSKQLAERRLHIPWSLYDAGACLYLLGRTDESVEAYAEAVYLSDGTWPLRVARAMVERIQCGLAGGPTKSKPKGLAGRVAMFLDAAAVAQAWKRERAEGEELDRVQKEKATASLALRQLGFRRRTEPEDVSLDDIEDAREKVKKLQEKVKEAKRRCRDAARHARNASASFYRRYVAELGRPLSVRKGSPLENPAVILAGSCDARFEPLVRSYQDTISAGFGGFGGTVYSGGTTAGIGRLAGDVQERYGPTKIRTVTYLPRRMASKPKWVKVDVRYTDRRRTDGNDFSVLEPVFSWADIIAGGVKPYDVKVVGINGGRIAGTEYRIALAFGAAVAVFERGGREAARLIADETWGVAPALIQLPKDGSALRAFIGTSVRGLTPAQELELAEAIHEGHREEKLKSGQVVDASLARWKDLPEAFRHSSMEQARDMYGKLSTIGCSVRRVPKGRAPVLMTFTKREIEMMAEMEHARWVIERLRAGWKLGPKSEKEKTSPYLVPWSALTEGVKEWDRATVRKMPAYLAKVGLEIVR